MYVWYMWRLCHNDNVAVYPHGIRSMRWMQCMLRTDQKYPKRYSFRRRMHMGIVNALNNEKLLNTILLPLSSAIPRQNSKTSSHSPHNRQSSLHGAGFLRSTGDLDDAGGRCGRSGGAGVETGEGGCGATGRGYREAGEDACDRHCYGYRCGSCWW